MTSDSFWNAVKTRVANHDPEDGSRQWYVDNHVIDCDAEEFWKVVEGMTDTTKITRAAEMSEVPEAAPASAEHVATMSETINKARDITPKGSKKIIFTEVLSHEGFGLVLTIALNIYQ